jgi:hypothetical protein
MRPTIERTPTEERRFAVTGTRGRSRSIMHVVSVRTGGWGKWIGVVAVPLVIAVALLAIFAPGVLVPVVALLITAAAIAVGSALQRARSRGWGG